MSSKRPGSSPGDNSLASISFFRFDGANNRWWAFKQMQLARQALAELPGSNFIKLMGCGAFGGFSWWPDFGTYAIFSSWKDRESYRYFRNESAVLTDFDDRATSSFHVLLEPMRSHGTWSGRKLFQPPSESSESPGGFMAVLTRATVNPWKIVPFWQLVPAISRQLAKQSGHVFSRGMGEWPFFELTTFSIWQSEALMKQFAYGAPAHLKAIKDTRRKSLFREDLFARFKVLSINGSWEKRSFNYNAGSSRAEPAIMEALQS